MNTPDIDLENINNIDMSINPALLDDDDDSFRSIKFNDNSITEEVDDRNFQAKTGIIIDLSDDDDLKPTKKLKVDIQPERSGLAVESNFSTLIDERSDFYNEIDMETNYSEDDDDLVEAKFTESSEIIQEAKFDGEVDKDYWRDLAKKHAKTNKPGAYNTHFHLSGNPKADMEFFNQAMGGHSGEFNEEGISATTASSNITGVANASSGGESSGFGESLESDNTSKYSKILKDLLSIINVEILINSDNSLAVLDLCDDSTEYTCQNIDELKAVLQPYMEDCFIYPLQINTNLKLSNCKDWVDWYSSREIQEKYPKLSEDIIYCDLVANHLPECNMEDLI